MPSVLRNFSVFSGTGTSSSEDDDELEDELEDEEEDEDEDDDEELKLEVDADEFDDEELDEERDEDDEDEDEDEEVVDSVSLSPLSSSYFALFLACLPLACFLPFPADSTCFLFVPLSSFTFLSSTPSSFLTLPPLPSGSVRFTQTKSPSLTTPRTGVASNSSKSSNHRLSSPSSTPASLKEGSWVQRQDFSARMSWGSLSCSFNLDEEEAKVEVEGGVDDEVRGAGTNQTRRAGRLGGMVWILSRIGMVLAFGPWPRDSRERVDNEC